MNVSRLIKQLEIDEGIRLRVYEDSLGYLTVGIGCTGGKHRSVAVAERLSLYLKKKVNVFTIHRDVEKE